MHHIETNKADLEKAGWELHPIAKCCLEQILEARPHKAVAVMAIYLSSHYPSK